MTLQYVQSGKLYYPFQQQYQNIDTAALGGNVATALDSASEACWMFGRLRIDGAAASKTLSAAGGGSIGFSAGTVTWATAGSTLRVGVTGISTTAGPTIRGDGTYSVYKDLVQGTDAITGSAWNTIAMGTGTATLNHGDLICLAFELTTRNGADVVNVQASASASNQTFPSVINFVSPSTYTSKNALPNCVITFDDGTLGWIDGAANFLAETTQLFNSGTAGADEYGNILRVPFSCKIDGMWFKGWNASTTGAVKLILYSDPLGTPAVAASFTLDYHQQTPTAARASWHEHLLASEITLSPNTDYAVTIQPQTTSNFTLYGNTVSAASHLKSWPGGTNSYAVKRLDATGALATDSTAKRYAIGVRISSLDDGAGGGGSSILVRRGMHGGIQ